MRFRVVTTAAACGVAAAVLISASGESRDREDRELLRAEVVRLRAHFDSVLVELEARDVSALGPSQRAARTELLRRLERYRDGGIFPHNHQVAGERVPYFRDEHGTLCAMAYLIASTGRTDIVDDVARQANNAYIPALASDARLTAWLDSVGLSVAEAARIQPAYNGPAPLPIVAQERAARSYALPSLALGVPALVTTVVNWRAPRDKGPDPSTWIGAISGAGAVVLGVAILSEEPGGSAKALGVADLAVGGSALTAVVRRSLRRSRPGASPPPVANSAARLSVDVAPVGIGGRIGSAARMWVRF